MIAEALSPWEHPNWYDLHDTAHSAGTEREPEHYRELLLALPPLDRADHLIDLGAGTGKLALLIARGYPSLGRLTLLEPNERKLAVARERLSQALPAAPITSVAGGLGEQLPLSLEPGTIATIGSVLMPIMTLRGGTLADGLAWLQRALADAVACVQPGGWLYALETLAAPWEQGGATAPVRRLALRELHHAFAQAGLSELECLYRFRDRVILRGRVAAGAPQDPGTGGQAQG